MKKMRKQSNYKGKYYDPNYRENKRKYGDSYDPKKFQVPNPDWKPRNNKFNSDSNEYDAGSYKHANQTMKSEESRKRRNMLLKNLLGLVIVLGIGRLVFQIRDNFVAEVQSIVSLNSVIEESTPILEDSLNTETTDPSKEVGPDIDSLVGNAEIEVDECDLSGERQSSVKVDIGAGDRQYYGYTNKNGQLVYTYADSLKLQDSSREKLLDGRYCSDEAAVPGTESSNYDQGHVIGDALGGVSNAYNITPQLSYLNQTEINNLEIEMQDILYNGGTVSNFSTKIFYPDSKTQIPSRYEISYVLNGEQRDYTFENN